MEIQSNISHPLLILFLIVILTVAIGYMVYFYKKNTDEFNKIQRIILASIKFVYLILIGILLLAPLAELIRNRYEKPIIVLGIDNSASMLADSSNLLTVNEFINRTNNELENKYQIETLLFDENTYKSDEITFSGLRSNYSNFIYEIEKRYFNLNVGALLLVGDGIFNQGKNPEQIPTNIEFPIYSIGIGDTTSRTDQAIVDVTHNSNVFKGNTFPVEVELNFTAFNQSNTQLTIYIDGSIALAERIEIPQPNYYFRKNFNLSSSDVGLRNVSIQLSPIKSEQNTRNNRYNFTIEVHDNKKEVLILTQGPHPDIGAITQTLNQKANYNIITTPIALFNGDIKEFDLVVLNQLPSLMHQNHPVFNTIKEEKLSVLVIVGPNTSISALNNLELGFNLNPTLLNENSEPFFNDAFQLFTIPDNIKQTNGIYPPLLTHYTEYRYSSDLSVVAYQKIKGIEMNYPLILTGSIGDQKIGAIMGEGIWRWRLREFQNFDNQDIFNQLIVNFFSYMTLKNEREQFKINYDRIASETSPYKIKAQVFNDIFEPAGNAEIKLLLTDSTGSEMSYLFDVNQTEYNLNLGILAPGKYNFKSTAVLGDKIFDKVGNFSIQEVNIEQQNLKSNFDILNLLAQNTGGQFFTIENTPNLLSMLNETDHIKTKTHKEKFIHELIDWKWYIFIIILLFSLEWFLRKFWGSY